MPAPVLRLNDLDLSLVMPAEKPRGAKDWGPGFSLGVPSADNIGTLNLSKAGYEDLAEPSYIQVFVTEGGIVAVKPCRPQDPGSRRLDSSRRVRAPEITEAFGITAGERFFVPGVIDQGHLLGEVPADLLERASTRREAGTS